MPPCVVRVRPSRGREFRCVPETEAAGAVRGCRGLYPCPQAWIGFVQAGAGSCGASEKSMGSWWESRANSRLIRAFTLGLLSNSSAVTSRTRLSELGFPFRRCRTARRDDADCFFAFVLFIGMRHQEVGIL